MRRFHMRIRKKVERSFVGKRTVVVVLGHARAHTHYFIFFSFWIEDKQ